MFQYCYIILYSLFALSFFMFILSKYDNIEIGIDNRTNVRYNNGIATDFACWPVFTYEEIAMEEEQLKENIISMIKSIYRKDALEYLEIIVSDVLAEVGAMNKESSSANTENLSFGEVASWRQKLIGVIAK